MRNSTLINAKIVKNDEFYTKYETIEEEVKHYKEHFEGKTVYCNCDDPRRSNFFKYFVDNFHELKLKRLIASCYVDQSCNLFTINEEREPAVWAEYDGWLLDGRVPKVSEIEVRELKGDGDFRSEESIELLKQSDIVVTNPPFSLFREFVSLIMRYGKKFLALGNLNALTYKEIFPYVKDGNLYLGPSIRSGDVEFEMPEHVIDETKEFREDEDGRRYVRVVGVRWYTNISEVESAELELTELYKNNEDRYPKYDNYDAINIDRISHIPKDYKGAMGVPISFMDKYNSKQFKILGQAHSWDNSGLYNGKLKTKLPILNGKALYARIFIQNKRLNPEIYGG